MEIIYHLKKNCIKVCQNNEFRIIKENILETKFTEINKKISSQRKKAIKDKQKKEDEIKEIETKIFQLQKQENLVFELFFIFNSQKPF